MVIDSWNLLAVYTQDCVADWELGLNAAGQHYERM